MAIIDNQAVLFFVLIILMHLPQMNIQNLFAFCHDTLHADLITLVKIMMFTNIAFIFNTIWYDIITETLPEQVTTLVLHIADKFAKEDLHFNQLMKGLKTSNCFQQRYMSDYVPNNILSGLYSHKLVSRKCALAQQTEALVKVFGDFSGTVFVVVENPDVEEGKLYDIFYDLPLVPNHIPSLHEDEGEKKKKRRKQFSSLSSRLETFTNSKLSTDARRFAESGFFFCGKLDRVCCYECGIVISKWKKEDDPLKEHSNHSRDCPFVVSLRKEDSSHDNSAKIPDDRHQEDKRSKKSARCPSYQSIEARLSTFGKFPNNNEICIQDIAQAGFYYTGMNDVVRCYFCDLGIRNWEYGDDPYMVHARFRPDCDHLRNVIGEDFIRHIQNETLQLTERPSPSSNAPKLAVVGKKEIQKENENFQKWNTIVQDQSRDKEKTFNNLFYTPAAQSVLEHGYKNELVLAAIRKLNITDETKLTAIQILEVIFDAEENGTDLTEKNIKYESQKYQRKNLQSPNEECQYLLTENQRLKDLMLCKQCQARERNILLLPCTHCSLCHECANKNNLCPECWKPIKERVRTYIP